MGTQLTHGEALNPLQQIKVNNRPHSISAKCPIL